MSRSPIAGHAACQKFGPAIMLDMTHVPSVELPPEFGTSVSREDVNRLPIVRYAGSIRLVATATDLQHAMHDILQESVVGFDTETRPAFRPGEVYLPSLVQFATASAVYLLQMQQQDLFEVTRDVLSSPNVIKAGLSVADDIRALKKLFAFEENATLDLGKIARHHGLKQTGVRNLAAIFLGARIPKGAKTTNWAARRLTPEQITYAATDAWTCRELYVRFKELKLV
jgi:ribonuclease D